MAEITVNIKPSFCPMCGATIKWENDRGTCKCSNSPEQKWKPFEEKGDVKWWLKF
jgi:hypothetical protein